MIQMGIKKLDKQTKNYIPNQKIFNNLRIIEDNNNICMIKFTA